jgi:excisionase family DNA binding protein
MLKPPPGHRRGNVPRQELAWGGVSHEPLAYRIPEAARRIGVSQGKVAELIARGDLASCKIDGSRIIRSADLAAYIKQLGGGGGDAAA